MAVQQLLSLKEKTTYQNYSVKDVQELLSDSNFAAQEGLLAVTTQGVRLGCGIELQGNSLTRTPGV